MKLNREEETGIHLTDTAMLLSERPSGPLVIPSLPCTVRVEHQALLAGTSHRQELKSMNRDVSEASTQQSGGVSQLPFQWCCEELLWSLRSTTLLPRQLWLGQLTQALRERHQRQEPLSLGNSL